MKLTSMLHSSENIRHGLIWWGLQDPTPIANSSNNNIITSFVATKVWSLKRTYKYKSNAATFCSTNFLHVIRLFFVVKVNNFWVLKSMRAFTFAIEWIIWCPPGPRWVQLDQIGLNRSTLCSGNEADQFPKAGQNVGFVFSLEGYYFLGKKKQKRRLHSFKKKN